MTVKQLRLLRELERWSGHGTIEVCIQYGEVAVPERKGETEEQYDARCWHATEFVVANLMRSLVKMNYASYEGGYSITEAGRAYLASLHPTRETA